EEESFLLEEQENAASARGEFLRRYYSMRDRVPAQVTVDGDVEDVALLEEWLTRKRGKRVHIVRPQIGEQARLAEMCRGNAAERIAHRVGMTGRENAALEELKTLLGLKSAPQYIECYDISHTAGDTPVAGMIVFKNGKPFKSAYRRFTVKHAAAGDDYAAMREVVGRRLDEYVNSETADGFGRKPDLILLDGGETHVAAVKPLVDSYHLDIPVFGIVKDDKHRTRAVSADGGEIEIAAKRTVFTLISAIGEEVHRFAIAYHRQKRGKQTVSTTLLQIPGIGAERAKALLRQFGSVKAVSLATKEELLLVKGMTVPAADAVYAFFRRETE
ncbi:MAG: excinuclease ABC subunit UvrC, partial [Clostridia bacterium]|nr:excinuclease ABC subunit UvrC [Clostridia bacterium]